MPKTSKFFPVTRLLMILFFVALAFVAGHMTALRQPVTIPANPSGGTSEVLTKVAPTISTVEAHETETADRKQTAEDEIKISLQRLGANLSSDAAIDEFWHMLHSWAAISPQAALEYAQHLPKTFTDRGITSDQAITAVLSDWAKNNQSACWQWAATNKSDYANAVLSQIGKTDAETAWSLAAEYSRTHPDDAQSAYLSALQGMLYSGNYAVAADLIKKGGLSATAEDEGLLADRVAGQWARYAPLKAAEWALTLPAGSLARERAMENMELFWGKADPKAAMEFAMQLPSDVGRRDLIINKTLMNWVESDPQKAAEWMNLFGPDPIFDMATQTITTSQDFTEDNVNVSLAWANTIVDPQLHLQGLTQLLSNWMAVNPVAAQNYFQNTSDLSPEMRNQILDRLGSNKASSPQTANPQVSIQ
jgi:hypothetical protein